MDVRAAFFTPEQAREIMDMVALLKSSGLLRSSSRVMRPDDPGPHPVFVKNESGEEAPAFACMQVVGTEDVGDLTYVKIDKPSSTDGQYLFNGESPIESGGYGMSYPWGVVKMLTNGAITANGSYGPTENAWSIAESPVGPFVVYGADNTGDNVARGRFGSRRQLVRFELLDSLLPRTALAELFTMEGHFLGIEPLRDPEGIFAALDEGDRGLAILQAGQYWAIQAACPKGDK